MSSNLVHLISRAKIVSTVRRLALEIERDHQDRSLVLIGILKGSFILLADLVKQIDIPIENIEFLRLSSYGSSMVSSGQATITMGLSEKARRACACEALPEGAAARRRRGFADLFEIAGKDIVLVEDIVDTGITTDTALRYLPS